MILQDHFTCIVDGRFDSGQLDQNLAAVTAVFHHTLDGFQMTDGPGQTVQHRLCILVSMGMSMSMAVLHYCTIFQNVLMYVRVYLLYPAFVQMCIIMFVYMFCHDLTVFLSSSAD